MLFYSDTAYYKNNTCHEIPNKLKYTEMLKNIALWYLNCFTVYKGRVYYLKRHITKS